MRYVVTPAEMAALDAHTIEAIGVPGVVLMERAALAVAEIVRGRYPGVAVLVACGPGNNGGDGFAVARMLHLWGVPVRCFALPMEYRGDALINLNAARNCGVGLVDDLDGLKGAAEQAGVLVDALFGTGLARDVDGQWAEAVDILNAAGKPIIAVDIPSGLDGETGRVRGRAVKAACTVTFQYAKLGHFLYPGREYAGELVTADIGIVENRALFRPCRVLEARDTAWPQRRANTHKGDYGHVAVVAGSAGMLGAGALAVRAALRGGSGLVTWLVPESLLLAASALVTEAMLLPLPDEHGHLAACSEQALREALEGRDAAVIGPGLSRFPDTVELIRNILHTIDIPMVVDADGLFALSGYPGALASDRKVLTPHPGEMARLMGSSIADVQADPLGMARRCAERFDAAAVLKGSTTVVASAGETVLNLTGNAGMATGGSGDVLAGLTGALLAQGAPAFEAAARACWLHGRAGDVAARRWGKAGMVAGDIVECLPEAGGAAMT